MNIDDLIKEAKKYSPINEDRIRDAYDFAQKAHAGQTRMSGEPYITHPLGVAMILAEYKADEESLVAALLHDVVEDTPHTLNEIEKLFGKGVTKMVDTLTKLPHMSSEFPHRSYQFDNKVESIRKIFEAMLDDVRVIIIKLCDRLHNMETLNHFRPDKQKRIAQETFDIYTRIADRLSTGDIKERLEELSLKYLYPEVYQKLQIRKNLYERNFLRNKKIIIEKIKSETALNFANDIIFRQVVHYSNFLENRAKEQLDIQNNVTLIFHTEKDCYLAIMEIHRIWKNIRGTFQDYVAFPKSNGYQAIETSVIKTDGTQLKFNLQTEQMYFYSKYGVMRDCFSSLYHSKKVQLPWVENLKRIHSETRKKSKDYIEALESDLLKDSITVYADDGNSLFLPPESTALDAAFFRFGEKAQFISAVFINNTARELSTFLKDRDNIRFELSNKSNLDPEWLNLVNTAFSKSVIFDISQKLNLSQKIDFGLKLLQKEFYRRGLGYVDEIHSSYIKKAFKEFRVSTINDLCLTIAEGKITPAEVSGVIKSQTELTEKSNVEYELEVKLLPNQFNGVQSILNAFAKKNVDVQMLNVKNLQNKSSEIHFKSVLNFPTALYDNLLKTIRGMPEVRFFRLVDVKQRTVGRLLLCILMVLVAMDPSISFFILNQFDVLPRDFVAIRFLTIFVLASLLLNFQQWRNGIIEKKIDYRDRFYVLSVLSIFSTAFFTYYVLSLGSSPFLYQLSIYVLLYGYIVLSSGNLHWFGRLSYIIFNISLFLFYFWDMYPESTTTNIYLLISLFLAALSFLIYTKSSESFQEREHIQRRHLSFFRSLAIGGCILSIIPYFFNGGFSLPGIMGIVVTIVFTTFFVFVPYVIYYIVAGTYGYRSDFWRKVIYTLPLVFVFQIALHERMFQFTDLVVILAFIGGYYLFSTVFSKSTS